jgi:hypothetical protein
MEQPPVGDDELTAEEEDGLLEAIAELDAGGGIPWEDVLRELRAKYAGGCSGPDETSLADGSSDGLGTSVT